MYVLFTSRKTCEYNFFRKTAIEYIPTRDYSGGIYNADFSEMTIWFLIYSSFLWDAHQLDHDEWDKLNIKRQYILFKALMLNSINSPDLKRTTAFKHANSASPTWRLRNRALISCSIRISAIVATIFSAGVLSTCIPAAARRGATSRGMFHWTAPMINNSLQPSSSKITWSLNGKFTNEGIFRAHFTEINNKRAADSQMASGVEQYSEVAISCCDG